MGDGIRCTAIIIKAKLPNGVVWPFSLYLESSSFSVVTKFQIAPLLMSSTKVNNNASIVESHTFRYFFDKDQLEAGYGT